MKKLNKIIKNAWNAQKSMKFKEKFVHIKFLREKNFSVKNFLIDFWKQKIIKLKK